MSFSPQYAYPPPPYSAPYSSDGRYPGNLPAPYPGTGTGTYPDFPPPYFPPPAYGAGPLQGPLPYRPTTPGRPTTITVGVVAYDALPPPTRGCSCSRIAGVSIVAILFFFLAGSIYEILAPKYLHDHYINGGGNAWHL